MRERTLRAKVAIDPEDVLGSSRRELARLPSILSALVNDLDPSTAGTRPATGEWAPIEILCHLRDEEAEDFGARLRAVLDGHAELPSIDPEGWVEARRYRDVPLGQALSDFLDRRAASLHFLTTIAPDRLRASAPHPSAGRLSGMDLLVAWVAHDHLHLQQLAATLARLWADRWTPLNVQYAGPIPYPKLERG
jgi:DinB superfamily